MGINLCCHRLQWNEVKNTRVFPKLGKNAAFIIDSHDRTVVIRTWKRIGQRQNECGEAIFVR